MNSMLAALVDHARRSPSRFGRTFRVRPAANVVRFFPPPNGASAFGAMVDVSVIEVAGQERLVVGQARMPWDYWIFVGVACALCVYVGVDIVSASAHQLHALLPVLSICSIVISAPLILGRMAAIDADAEMERLVKDVFPRHHLTAGERGYMVLEPEDWQPESLNRER